MKLKPKIISKRGFTFLGCVFYGDPFHAAEEWSYENEIGHLWQRFMKLAYKYSILLDKIRVGPQIGYEIHIEPGEYEETKRYYVFVGMEVSSVEEVPMEMFVKTLPVTKYLVCTTEVSEANEIEALFKKWIPENNLEQAYPYIIQAYDAKRYRGLYDKTSEIDWFIPIRSL